MSDKTMAEAGRELGEALRALGRALRVTWPGRACMAALEWLNRLATRLGA